MKLNEHIFVQILVEQNKTKQQQKHPKILAVTTFVWMIIRPAKNYALKIEINNIINIKNRDGHVNFPYDLCV